MSRERMQLRRPASCMVKPWLTTWLTTVARISSAIMALFLALPPLPHPPPLTLTPLPLWSPPTVALTLLKLWFQIAQQPLEMEVLPFEWQCVLSEHKEIWHWWSVQNRIVCSVLKKVWLQLKSVSKADNCVYSSAVGLWSWHMSDRLGSWPRAAESSGLWRGNDALWWLHLVLHTTRLCSPQP